MAGPKLALLLPLLACSVAGASFELPEGPFPLHGSGAPTARDLFDVGPVDGPPIPHDADSALRPTRASTNRRPWLRDDDRAALLQYRRHGGLGPVKYAEWLGKDFVNVFATPVHWSAGEWKLAALGTSGIVVLSRLDDPVNDWFVDHPGETRSNALEAAQSVFGPSSVTIYSLAMFASGQLSRNETLADTGFLALESILFARVTSGALKSLTQRDRPRYAEGAYELAGPQGSGTSSFVSMDTISAFAFASSVSEMVRRPWARWTLYSLAGLIALQRLDAGAHWLTDVVAAGFLGHAIGRRTVRLHYPRSRDREPGMASRLLRKARPAVAGDAVALTLTFEF